MGFTQLILTFSLFCYITDATDDTNACMNREYKPYDDYDIMRKFDGEYSIISGGIQKLFGKPEVPSVEEKTNVQQLCACAIFKYKQKNDNNEFNNIFLNTVAEVTEIKFPISYYFTMVKHSFPAHSCKFKVDETTETYIITKGYKKRSSKNQIFNIYVGIVSIGKNKKQGYNLKGIIDKVDVEMPVFGTSKNIPASGTSENQEG